MRNTVQRNINLNDSQMPIPYNFLQLINDFEFILSEKPCSGVFNSLQRLQLKCQKNTKDIIYHASISPQILTY